MITKDNLLKEISSGELLELSDLDSTGLMDEGRITYAINEALAYIASFILIPSNPTPLLMNIAVDLAINELRKAHDLGNKEIVKECDEKLLKMARGVLPTTISTSNETNTPRIGNAYKHTKRKYHSITKGFTHGY